MAYAATNARPQAIIGVAAIHAVLGVAVVTGLAGGVATILDDETIIGINIKKPVEPPPPPPDPRTSQDQQFKEQTKIHIPPRPNDLPKDGPKIDSSPEVFSGGTEDTGPIGNPGLGDALGGEPPKLPPLKDLVAPRARNGNWVTDNDYRTTWINRGWEGTAGFRLTIGKNGRVQNCTITQSTGHSALDEATCKHVTSRARFDPAKDSQGDTVSGTFSSAVRWEIPE